MKKLTLSMDEKDIRAARRIAKEHNTSISGMFTRLIRVMTAQRRGKANGVHEDLPPITKRLTGIITLPKGKTDREIIEEAILERHGIDL